MLVPAPADTGLHCWTKSPRCSRLTPERFLLAYLTPLVHSGFTATLSSPLLPLMSQSSHKHWAVNIKKWKNWVILVDFQFQVSICQATRGSLVLPDSVSELELPSYQVTAHWHRLLPARSAGSALSELSAFHFLTGDASLQQGPSLFNIQGVMGCWTCTIAISKCDI